MPEYLKPSAWRVVPPHETPAPFVTTRREEAEWFRSHGATITDLLTLPAAAREIAEKMELEAERRGAISYAHPLHYVARWILRQYPETMEVQPTDATRRRLMGKHADPRVIPDGAGLIVAERRRQVEAEGYDASHDAAHNSHELLIAARNLLECARGVQPKYLSDPWGLAAKHGKDPVRCLVIAGALLAAEIDRLQRASPRRPTVLTTNAGDGE
jgi:hypothetical protein